MDNKTIKKLLIAFVFIFGLQSFGIAQSVDEGRELFVSKTCASCHDPKFKTKVVGPNLADVESRWENKKDLFAWIRNPQTLLDAKNEYATKLFEENNKVPMTPNPDLTDTQIQSILMYINSGSVDLAKFQQGKDLFDSKTCSACHDKTFQSKLVGPNLKDVENRWSSKADLFSWIRNPQTLLDAKNEYATKLFEENNKVPMTPNPDITDEEITSILYFIKNYEFANVASTAATNTFLELDKSVDSSVTNKDSFFSSTFFYSILLALLLVIALWLGAIVSKARIRAFKDEFGEDKKFCVLQVLFANRTVLKFAVFGFLVFGTYYTAIRGIALGRQQDYQPDQPITYSHKIHAGDNKIDCNFCHDAARRSRHAMIPPTSTCMKCHKAIKTGSLYGTQELTKIYASIGFNPNSGMYIDNYDQMADEDIKKIFTDWISQQNNNDSKVAEEQWANIVKSLTNDTKTSVQGPIEWTRIHNLPDHVYFNHSQHVTVGKLECQACHGPIQEMEVVKQYAPLSMGWCVNCHRQTDVKFDSNKYYDEYFAKYHTEINEGRRSGVKVADIGGLDCQKCHY